ncbi:MAG: response regulator, partial [Deltaproteobacteria bacterium]|nr:response regulator [Deltaproteobacteria bacterium]
KDVGKGTGLGLSVSRRIVEGMGGGISVASSPENGTTFTISLLHSRPANRKEAALKPGPALDYSCLTDKAVLIVDDEEGLLKAVKESISPMVSSIEGASDGRTAFERIMDRDFDFIFLDIKMPGMSGMELYRAVNECKPYLTQRIIFLTGDTESETTGSFIKLTGCRYLAKPCVMKDILDAMRGCRYLAKPCVMKDILDAMRDYEMEIKQLERT